LIDAEAHDQHFFAGQAGTSPTMTQSLSVAHDWS
jgi:hypothetical protein